MSDRAAHPDNVPGPFYVVDGCCTQCGVPETIAPHLFGLGRGEECFVKRQPSGEDELEQMVEVVLTQELGCIRYRGDAPPVLIRLAQGGGAEQCDRPVPAGAVPVHRSRASIVWTERVRVEAFAHLLAQAVRGQGSIRVATLEAGEAAFSFSVAWYKNVFHRVAGRLETPSHMRIDYTGPVAVGRLLHDAIRPMQGVASIEWMTHSGGDAAPWPV